MLKKIIGGVLTVAIGGTMYTISQSDITENFASNTGMSQQQAEQYINDVDQSDLMSFSEVGDDFISDGNSMQSLDIDCDNNTYEWVTPSLTCTDGKQQMDTIAKDEIVLGNCYKDLDDSQLENSLVNTKIGECITDIDTVNSDYSLPIVAEMDTGAITEALNTNNYNKSILQALLSD